MNLLDAALLYASHGWHVFPVVPDDKRPCIAGWQTNATTDPTRIKAWWAQWPAANIGIATDPSGIVVYDVDIAGGKRGAFSHAQIANDLTPTLRAITRSGGEHWYYTPPPGAVNLRRIGIQPAGVTVPSGESSGLDLIANGYVLAPPSIVGGRPYVWDNASNASIAPLPELLVDAARRPPARASNAATDGEIIAGERNNTLYKLACRYRGAGLSHEETLTALMAVNAARVRPPLDEAEIELIVASATSRAEFDTPAANDALLNLLVDVAPEVAWYDAPAAGGDHKDDESARVDAMLDSLLLANGAASLDQVVKVYATGFDELDQHLGGGLATRQLAVIMGGPAAGKSALAVTLARHIATPREGYEPPPVLVISTELEFSEVAARFAAPALKEPWRDIVRRKGASADVRRVTDGLGIYVLDTTKLSRKFERGLEQILEFTLALGKRHGQEPVVIVDYLQELSASVAGAEVRQKTGEIATLFRMFSQRADAAFVAISSVSRSGYGTSLEAIREQNDPLAYLALAKESGSIEYAAAAVLFVDVEPEEMSEFRIGRVAIAKSRHGKAGFVGVRFAPAIGEYYPAPGEGKTMGAKQRKAGGERDRIVAFLSTKPYEYTQRQVVDYLSVNTASVGVLIHDGVIERDGKGKLAVAVAPA